MVVRLTVVDDITMACAIPSTPSNMTRAPPSFSHALKAITCLAMHPDKAHVATGQGGSAPCILVWNSSCKSRKTKARLQLGDDKTGVSQVGIRGTGVSLLHQ